MTQPRLSTVYDFSDLRLHSDGTRVYQKSTNLRTDLVKVTTRNSRFNWIAKDAGGSASVPRFRKKPKVSKEQEEDEEMDVDLPSQEEESTGGSQESSEEGDDDVRKNGKKRKPKRIDTRKPKRLKFSKNYGYLDSESHPPAESAGEAPEAPDYTIKLPEPSADLLKCIHRFASEFYTERGQLLNISREYRKERKQRALQKRARNEKRASKKKEDHEDSAALSGLESELSESETPPQDADDSSEGEESSGREVSDGGENDEGGSSSKNTKVKGKAKSKKPWKRKGRRRTDKLYTDMYKMFDGSAMMALGMLVQEQIAHMLNPDVPDGWEEEMKRYYGDVQDDLTESIDPSASVDKAVSTGEGRGSGAQDEAGVPQAASHRKQFGSMGAESQTSQTTNRNPLHQFDNTFLLSQSSPKLSTAGTNAVSDLEHEVDEDDPIQPWSEDSEDNENSDSQGGVD